MQNENFRREQSIYGGHTLTCPLRAAVADSAHPQTHSPPPSLTIPSAPGQYSSQSPPHSSNRCSYLSRPSTASFYQSYGVSAYPVPETPTSNTTSSLLSSSFLSVSASCAP